MKNNRITNLRVLAIIIVVFGHSIILYSSKWNLYQTNYTVPILDIIKNLINMVQMQLYFSLSGYLFYYSQKKCYAFKKILKDKLYRLLIPYISIAALWMVPIRLLVKYPGYEGMSYWEVLTQRILLGKDNGHLWFLLTLFIIFIIMYTICGNVYRIENDSIYLIVAGVLLVISMNGNKFPIMNNVMHYLFWFYFGFFMNHFESKMIFRKKRYFIFGGFILVFSAIIVKSGLFLQMEYLVSLCFLIILYMIVPQKTNKVIETIDKNSFGIYLFHSPLIYITYSKIPNCKPGVVVFINFVIFGILAYLITIFVRKAGLLFLIGEKTAK